MARAKQPWFAFLQKAHASKTIDGTFAIVTRLDENNREADRLVVIKLTKQEAAELGASLMYWSGADTKQLTRNGLR